MSNNVKLFFPQDSTLISELAKFIEEALTSWNKERSINSGKLHTVEIKEDHSNGVVYGFESVKYFDISVNGEPTQSLVISKNFDNTPEAGLKSGEGMVAMISDFGRGRQIMMALQHQTGYADYAMFSNSTLLDVNDEIINLDLKIVFGDY